jgi:acyl-CoA thioesterase-2
VVMAARPPREGHDWRRMMGASLDHALWFHRPTRADQWLLYDLHALSTSNARGLVRGTMHTRAGVLGVSVTQEALIRIPRPGTPMPRWEPGPES